MIYIENWAVGWKYLDKRLFSIEELSELTGYDRRTIRSFIEQGLLRGAERMGRYAQYSETHLLRLSAIRAMKETLGMSLSSIRSSLLSMSESEMKQLSQRFSTQQNFDTAAKPAEEPVSALDYLLSIRPGLSHQHALNGAVSEKRMQAVPVPQKQEQENRSKLSEPKAEQAPESDLIRLKDEKPSDMSSLECLLGRLNEILGKSPRASSKAEVWQRIAITPDLELSVRGELDPVQLLVLERIADHLREFLLETKQ